MSAGHQSRATAVVLSDSWFCSRRFGRDAGSGAMPSRASPERVGSRRAAWGEADGAGPAAGFGGTPRELCAPALPETLGRRAAPRQCPESGLGTHGTRGTERGLRRGDAAAGRRKKRHFIGFVLLFLSDTATPSSSLPHPPSAKQTFQFVGCVCLGLHFFWLCFRLKSQDR